MRILIVNGPNLNKIGVRETGVYGNCNFGEFLQILRNRYSSVELDYFQSNSEGELIDRLQTSMEEGFQGIIFNPGAYSHSSIALRDTLSYVNVPVIEVHISNIYARQKFRHHSYISAKCIGVICGLGLKGYELAIDFFYNHHN